MTDLITSTDLPVSGLPVSGLPVSGATPSVSAAERERIRKTAEEFEAAFLSQMLKPMFEGLKTDGPFGGGEAEATWRSFMLDAMAKKTVQAGGIGLADTVMAEMIKMQSEPAQ